MNLDLFVSISFIFCIAIGFVECDSKENKAEFNVTGEGFHR